MAGYQTRPAGPGSKGKGRQSQCVGTDTLGHPMLLTQRLDGCLAAFLCFLCDW